MRKVIVLILLLTIFCTGFSWADGVPTERISWEEFKTKLMATRERQDLFLLATMGGFWLKLKLGL